MMLNHNALFLLGVIVYLVLLVIWIKKKLTVSFIFVRSVFCLYVVGVFDVALFPIPIDKNFLAERLQDTVQPSNNYIPFVSILQLLSAPPYIWIKQIIGNVLLLSPLGFLFPMLKANFNNTYKIAFAGLFSSISIEITQQLISSTIGYQYRTLDVDDILLNVTGTFLGFIMFKAIYPLFSGFYQINDKLTQKP